MIMKTIALVIQLLVKESRASRLPAAVIGMSVAVYSAPTRDQPVEQVEQCGSFHRQVGVKKIRRLIRGAH